MEIAYTFNEIIYEPDGVINIATELLVSATQANCTDIESLDYHRQFDPSVFPAILGYYETISDEDIGVLYTVDGKLLDNSMIGKCMFRVIQGHHRSMVAIEQGVNLSCTYT
jgi:hypothetical protein